MIQPPRQPDRIDNEWLLLLLPGIGVKRWLGVAILGVVLLGIGGFLALESLSIVAPLRSMAYWITLHFLPLWQRGLLLALFGLCLIAVGAWRLYTLTSTHILPNLRRPENREMLETLIRRQRRSAGPKIVAIGGGTGMPQLLRGLRQYTDNITAIVTVADDGGSSGRLRQSLGTLPPGDFRNNIAALSDTEGLMKRLFQYRFPDSSPGNRETPNELAGHSFGNLFISTMAAVTGSFEAGIAESSKVLRVRGRVLPSTLENIVLGAELRRHRPDGSEEWINVEGESQVPEMGGRIERVYLKPEHVRAYPEAIKAILQADLIVAGPGSFFTSIIPNLLVDGIREAIRAAAAPRIYICNVVTQPGETDGYTVSDHMRKLREHASDAFTDVLANDNYDIDHAPSPTTQWVTVPAPDEPTDYTLHLGDIVDLAKPSRHDSAKLAARLMELYSELLRARSEAADEERSKRPRALAAMGVATMTQRMQHLTTWLLVLTFGWVVVKSAWLADDAFITLRTVDNWLAGFGPVWNVTERVQAYTHPLWLLLLTGVAALTREYFFSTIAASIVLSLAAFYLVVGKLAVDWGSALLAGAVLLLSKAFVDYSTSGLENALTHLLLALFLWRFFCRLHTLRTLFWLSLLTALGAVNRLDSLLLFAPPLLYAALTPDHSRRRALGVLALGMTPLLLWESFSLVYYGFPLPNTYYAKLDTGLPLAALVEQGFYYFLHSAGADPLTLAAILAGVTLPWLTRAWRQAAVAVGVVLYLLYILRIGGDFMAGRFFSAPLLVSAAILARQPLLTLPRWQIAGVLILTVALGFTNPGQSPWLSRADYAVGAIDGKGIADERGHYYQRYGLLPANRENRLRAAGAITGTPDPALFDHCGIGMRGFLASPYTHIVDYCGLADALIARLPTIYDPAWRIGHPIRHIPDGYLGTLRTGQNQLSDADLARFYDQLSLVIRGPIFDPARWQAIWEINTGQIAPTRNPAAYIYPDRATKAWADFDRTWPETVATAADASFSLTRGAIFGAQGVTIALGERHHAPWVDLDIDADSFDLIFLDGTVEVGRSAVRQTPLQLGDQRVAMIAAPPAAVAHGYDNLVVAPQLVGSHHLARVALLDPAQWAVAPPHVADLLRLAYAAFYQQLGAGRAELLDSILATAENAPPAEWQAIPPQFTVDLLKAPDPALQALVLSRATPNQVLVDDQDRPLLRYLGHRTEALPADANEPGIHARLYFEVLAPASQDYTLWFHAENQESGAEFMLYDWPLPVDATTWSTGMIAEVPVFIALAPGEYKLTAGLWTPETRRRLYADRSADVYWLDLGVASAVAPSAATDPSQTK